MDTNDRSDELKSRFLRACEYVTKHASSLDSDVLFLLYGYFKQATVGPCNTPKPSPFNFKAKTMWKSWANLGTLAPRTAMQQYILHLSECAGNWDTQSIKTKNEQWVSVSSLSVGEEAAIQDSAKDLFDWVKDGNLDRVKQCAEPFSVHCRDGDGLYALHWAADRGHLDVVKYLVLKTNANVDCFDGDNQTPLHYAAACGHLDVCQFLVHSGANLTAKDKDGLSPMDVAEDVCIRKFFQSL